MTPLALIYHERYAGRGTATPRLAKSWSRYKSIFELCAELNLPIRHFRQAPPSDELLRLAHQPEYVEWVRQMDLRDEGFLDRNDTPAYRGVFRRAAIAVGGTLLGARLVADGLFTIAFNPGGGLHHAHADRTSGFCVFNDLVIATRWLMRERGVQRPLIIDFDGHHGDGTQALLYHEPILTVSLHQYDGRFYPGTGRVEERGAGPGEGYCLNIPLHRRTGPEPYLEALDTVVLPVVRAYQPDFILVQYGVDAHFADKLVSLRLNTWTYATITQRLLRLAQEYTGGRLLVCGGGGYTPEAVIRCWGVMLATLAACPEDAAHLHDDPATIPTGNPVSDATSRETIVAAARLHLPAWGHPTPQAEQDAA
jgi:acetoin utilization protein AcuC